MALGVTGAGSPARAAFAHGMEEVKGLPVEAAEPVSGRATGAGASVGVENIGGGTKAVAGAKAPGGEGLDVAMPVRAAAGGAVPPARPSRKM